MKESDLRKWHRMVGILLALFVIIQVITGIVLSVEDLLGHYWGGIVHDLHYGSRFMGSAYRIALGAGLMWMIVSGWLIYRNIRRRTKPQRK